MKTLLWVWLLMMAGASLAQPEKAETIFIITTEGLRWQEGFNGAYSLLLSNSQFVKDTALARQLYWHSNTEERRKLLMPFFWNVLAAWGQLYGNREKQSKLNVKNIYKISYPGYNELLTGYADPLPILNGPQYNRDTSILEFFNNLLSFKDSLAAITSFPFLTISSFSRNNPMTAGMELYRDRMQKANSAVNR